MQKERIEPFHNRDASEVSSLIRETLIKTNSDFYPEEVINFLYKEHSEEKIIEMSNTKDLFVVKQDSTVIGVGGLEDKYIETVFIHPKYQNQGIGKAIMEKIESRAKEKGIDKVILNSSINAVPFYKKMGYKKQRKIEQENYGVTFEMTKNL